MTQDLPAGETSPNVPTRSETLVATKLRVPGPRRGLLPRPRLVALLAEAVEAGVVVVSAPAGFGKTISVAEWARSRSEPVGWLSVDEGDSDPVRFWRHLVAAVGVASPATAERVRPVAASGELALNAVVTSLINGLSAVDRDVVVVVDDYDAVDSPVIHSTFGYLVSYRPANLKVVLTTRIDPPLPLARLRVDGELRQVGTEELRFRNTEVSEFLRSVPWTASLPDSAVESLAERTEGWAAGLQLAALSLDGRPDPEPLIDSFSGSHRFVVDFLTQEVLERQNPVVRRFLQETSLLDHLTASLCHAVTGRPDSQTLLEQIERSNLFLVPLDDRRGWWRYHRLFADALRDRMEAEEPDLARSIHRRAAEWYRSHGIADQAIAHAFAADDAGWAADMVEENVDELFLLSERATLEHWLARFSPEMLDRRPRLLLARARQALQRGDLAPASRWLDRAEMAMDGAAETALESFRPSVGPGLSISANPRAALALNRAIAAEYAGASHEMMSFLQQASTLAGADEWVLLAIVQGHMGIAEWLEGRLEKADQHLDTALHLCREADQPSLGAWVGFYQGAIHLVRGDLRSAERTYLRILDETAASAGSALPASGVGHAGLAAVALERDELETARHHLETGIPLCRALAFGPPLASSLVTLARLKRAQGDLAGASSVLDQEGIEAAPLHPVVSVLDPVRAERARLAVAMGDLESARDWAQRQSTNAEAAATYIGEAERLIWSRTVIDDGDHEAALPILDRLQQRASTEGRVRSLIEIEILRAKAISATGEARKANAALRSALDLAAETGHVRLFAEEGVESQALLSASVAAGDDDRPPEKVLDHIRMVREAVSRSESGPSRSHGDLSSSLIDPLSARELEVLQLVALGRSNREIADELYIAVDTVKRHLTHIFMKLGASNRTEAAARARRLGLLA